MRPDILNTNRPPALLPFYIGIYAALQIVTITVYMIYGYQFPGEPTLVLLPGWIVLARAGKFFFETNSRALVEGKTLLKRKTMDQQAASVIELENTANRMRAAKIMVFGVPWLMANLSMEFRKEDIPIWIAPMITALILVGLAMEGQQHGVLWWDDERQLTIEKTLIVEEDEEQQ